MSSRSIDQPHATDREPKPVRDAVQHENDLRELAHRFAHQDETRARAVDELADLL